MSLDEKDMDYLKKLFFNDDGTLKQELPPPNMYPFIEKALMNIALGNPAVYAMGLKLSNIGAMNYINQMKLRNFKKEEDKKKIKNSIDRLEKTIMMSNGVIAKLIEKANGKSCPRHPTKKDHSGPEITQLNGGRGKRGTKKRRVIKSRKKTRKNILSQKGGCKFCGNSCSYLYSVLADTLGVCLVCNSECRRYRTGNKIENKALKKGTEKTEADPGLLCCGRTGNEHTFTQTKTLSVEAIKDVLHGDRKTNFEVNMVFENLMIHLLEPEQLQKAVSELTDEMMHQEAIHLDAIMDSMVNLKVLETYTEEEIDFKLEMSRQRKDQLRKGEYMKNITAIAKVNFDISLKEEKEKKKKEEQLEETKSRIEERNQHLIVKINKKKKEQDAAVDDLASTEQEDKKRQEEQEKMEKDTIINDKELNELKSELEILKKKLMKLLPKLSATKTKEEVADEMKKEKVEEGKRKEKFKKEVKEEVKKFISEMILKYLVDVRDAGRKFVENEKETFEEIFNAFEQTNETIAKKLNKHRNPTLFRSLHKAIGEFIEGERPQGANNSRRHYWKNTIGGIINSLFLRTVTEGIQALDQGKAFIANNEILTTSDGTKIIISEPEIGNLPKVPTAPQLVNMFRGDDNIDPQYSLEEISEYTSNSTTANMTLASQSLRTVPLFAAGYVKQSKFYFVLAAIGSLANKMNLWSQRCGPIPVIPAWLTFMCIGQHCRLDKAMSYTDPKNLDFVKSCTQGPKCSMFSCDKMTSYLADCAMAAPQYCFRETKKGMDFVSADTICLGVEIFNGLLICNSLSGVVESWDHNARQVRLSEDVLRNILNGNDNNDELLRLLQKDDKFTLQPDQNYLFNWKMLKEQIMKDHDNPLAHFEKKLDRKRELGKWRSEAVDDAVRSVNDVANMRLAEVTKTQGLQAQITDVATQKERNEIMKNSNTEKNVHDGMTQRYKNWKGGNKNKSKRRRKRKKKTRRKKKKKKRKTTRHKKKKKRSSKR